MSYQRINRVTEEIRREISNIVLYELKDPRISEMASIVRADVTRDLSYAKIYVSVLGTDEEKQETIKALQGAAGFIRKELGRRLKIRYIPEIQFVLETSIEYSIEINKKLKEIYKEDN